MTPNSASIIILVLLVVLFNTRSVKKQRMSQDASHNFRRQSEELARQSAKLRERKSHS